MRLARRLRERSLAKRFPRDPASEIRRRQIRSVGGLVANTRRHMRLELDKVLAGNGDVWKLMGHIDSLKALKTRGVA